MGAAVALHESQRAAPRTRATVTSKPILVTAPARSPHVARASAIVADAVATCGMSAVADRADVDHSLVSRWADPSSERLPNVGHLLAEGGTFARGVLTGALAEIEAAHPVDPSRVEQEALTLAARMGQVLVAIRAYTPALPREQARALCREAAALADQADRLRRVLALLAREAR